MEQDRKAAGKHSCREAADTYSGYRAELGGVVDQIFRGCDDSRCYSHIDYEQLPSRAAVVDIVHKFREVLYPGYFSRSRLDPVNLYYHVGRTVSAVFDMLAEQISWSIRHECFKYDLDCSECVERGYRVALALVEAVPKIQNVLAGDVIAAYEGDPAAKSYDEIIFSYPGMLAITVHRLASRLYQLEVPLLPRIMSEYVHGETGIDIHPGADIGESFVIDHGTGVVIGDRSVIGGNVWITDSVPQDTTVLLESPRLIYR